MKNMAVLSLVVLLIVSVANPALAALVNIDFGAGFGGNGGNAPSSTFGAASGQTGAWNNITAFGTTFGLLDIGGNATIVDITLTGHRITGYSGLPPGDANDLMEDNFYANWNQTWSISLTNLNDGIYNIYLYEPHHSSVSTGAGNANGVSFGNINGGFGSGTFIQGSNYHLLSGVTISGGTLSVTGLSSRSSGLSGMQITPVPIPASIILMGSGLVGFIGFWRRFKK